MRYGHAIAMTMASALAADPALAQNSPVTASGGQATYGQSAFDGQSSSYVQPTHSWVVSEPDIHAFSGPRAEVRADWSDLTGPSTTNGGYGGGYGGYCGGYSCSSSQKLSSNIGIGGEIGYDVPISHSFTVGPYAGFMTNISTSSGCLSCTGNDYSIGIRAGFIASHRFLVYGKIGYNSLNSNINYAITSATTGAITTGSTSFNYTGAEYGVGINYLVSKKTYLGLELMGDSYGNGDPYYGGNQRFNIGLSLGMHL